MSEEAKTVVENAAGDHVKSTEGLKPNGEEVVKNEADQNSKTDIDQEVRKLQDPTQIQKLEAELQKRTNERDDYQKKLEVTEVKLLTLQASYDAITSNEDADELSLKRKIEDLKNALIQTKLKLEDRDRKVAGQETQIDALNKQVSSLKEVVSITKDLLNIRNLEVKNLQQDVDSMENKIVAERERHKSMLNKMDDAVRLNADLKKEYETQLRLFQDLRGKYEEKVTLLSEENKVLENAAASKSP